MKTPKRAKTPNRGAAGERAAILRKVRAMKREWAGFDEAGWVVFNKLCRWIEARDARQKGGL